MKMFGCNNVVPPGVVNCNGKSDNRVKRSHSLGTGQARKMNCFFKVCNSYIMTIQKDFPHSKCHISNTAQEELTMCCIKQNVITDQFYISIYIQISEHTAFFKIILLTHHLCQLIFV